MVTCSSILAWKIPWTEEAGGLQSTGPQRVGHYWATEHVFHVSIFPVRAFLKYLVICGCSLICSVQFARSVVSDSLRPHELQHARPPCPSSSPRFHSDSRPSSPWSHPAISSWVAPFSSCPQSLPALESFPMSQLFAWGGQSTGVSALASFLPKYTQDWSPLEWTGWISLQFNMLMYH